VRVRGNLDSARVSLQIDVGFGDAIVPAARKVVFPVLLDLPAPEMKGYSKESTIWVLCHDFDFTGEMLAEAVRRTFKKRNTTISAEPTVFHASFAQDENKKLQWQGFITKARLADGPPAFEDVVAAIKLFLGPLVATLAEHQVFRGTWTAPGPWR
jgi:hypothetical protein